MNKKLATAVAVSVVALSFFQMRGDDASVAFNSFRISPEVSLRLPIVPKDSVLAKKNSFSNEKLRQPVTVNV
ncbi:MAG: hypothetical protein K2J46_09290 [Muribaculaceae bacterium]|nr:hypothetical protein [Muribaculaceae bacterium]